MIEMELIAYIAAFFKSSAFLPQTLHVLKTGNTKGLSLITYTALVLGVGMWLAYGILNQIWPLAIASAVSVTISSSIFVVVLKNRFPRFKAFFRLKQRRRRAV